MLQEDFNDFIRPDKSSKNECFIKHWCTDGVVTNTYSVPKIWKIAEDFEVEQFKIEDFIEPALSKYYFKSPIPETFKRIAKANVTYPIILHLNTRNKQLKVLDGWHRLMKIYILNQFVDFNAIVLTQEDIKSALIDTKTGMYNERKTNESLFSLPS